MYGQPTLYQVKGIDKKPFDGSPPVLKHQRPSNVRYIPSIDGMTGRPFKGQ